MEPLKESGTIMMNGPNLRMVRTLIVGGVSHMTQLRPSNMTMSTMLARCAQTMTIGLKTTIRLGMERLMHMLEPHQQIPLQVKAGVGT